MAVNGADFTLDKQLTSKTDFQETLREIADSKWQDKCGSAHITFAVDDQQYEATPTAYVTATHVRCIYI